MSNLKLMSAIFFFILLGNIAVAHAADLEKGKKAYDSGDYESALLEFVPLAEQGDGAAQNYLGLMYLEGIGVPKNQNTGLMWIKKVQKETENAQTHIGLRYNFGWHSFPQNHKKAIIWFTKAAEQGDSAGQYFLGFKYRWGEGVEKNNKTAANWYIKAAKQGHAHAQHSLAGLYESGRGVLQDYVKAYMWFNLAAYNGIEAGDKERSKLTMKMTLIDISTAQKMSRQCLESGYIDC
jgi:TPR repeat protein